MAIVNQDISSRYTTTYNNTYHSISGIDIKSVIAGVTFGNIQAISYSVTREKAPIYTMGSPDPRGFGRGKRGIAGSMVFVMFDSHAFLDTMRGIAHKDGRFKFVSDNDESRPFMQTEPYENVAKGRVSSPTTVDTTAQTSNREEGFSGPLNAGWKRVVPWYSDQIPPFNIVLTGVNEQGYAAVMAILGAEILNEGYGISIDDIIGEVQTTYVARAIAPWQRVVDEKLHPKNATQQNFFIPSHAASSATP